MWSWILLFVESEYWNGGILSQYLVQFVFQLHWNLIIKYCYEWFPLIESVCKSEVGDELHNILTEELLTRIKSGEASTQDLKAAIDWLKQNDITGVAYEGNPLDKLANIMPTIDPELVQQRLYGKR